MDFGTLQREAEADGRRPVVGALVLDRQGRVFIQRRGPDRAFLPNGWDLVGGHVEAGETLIEALHREVAEETGWAVVGESQLAFVGDWRADPDDPASARREFDFLVDVEGDLDRPLLEWPKHTEARWIGAAELSLLDENRGRDDGLVRHLAEVALRSARRGQLSFPHVTLFVEPTAAGPIEAMRRRWDPAMASQIAAHVSVAYPGEIESVPMLADRLREAAGGIGPFELRLGPMARRRGAHWWVGAQVVDPDGGWSRLRAAIVPPANRRAGVDPHATIVHPRHSNLGAAAWPSVSGAAISVRCTVSKASITAYDGRRWVTVEDIDLDD